MAFPVRLPEEALCLPDPKSSFFQSWPGLSPVALIGPALAFLSGCSGRFVTLDLSFTFATAYCGREAGNEQARDPWSLLDALRKLGGLGVGHLCQSTCVAHKLWLFQVPTFLCKEIYYKKPTRDDHSGTAYAQLEVFIPPSWDYTQVFGTKFCV